VKLPPILAAVLLVSCAPTTTVRVPHGPPPDPAAIADAEIQSMLAELVAPIGATARAEIQSLAIVADACHGAGAYDDLLAIWDTPDATGPAVDAVVAACSGICDDLAAVLTLRGWTTLPTCPPVQSGISLLRCQYMGSFLIPGEPLDQQSPNADIAYVAGGTLMVSGPGGIIRVRPPATLAKLPGPAGCPVATQIDGPLSPFDTFRPLTTITNTKWYRGTCFLVDRAGHLHHGSTEYYNTGNTKHAVHSVALDIVSTGLAAPLTLGAWTINGWDNDRTAAADPGNGGYTLLPPAWSAAVLGPGEWIGCGGNRVGGALGSGRGPNLCAFILDETIPKGGQQVGKTLMYFPDKDAMQWPRYQKSDKYDAEFVWLRDGSAALIVGAMKGLGSWYYGPGPSCSTRKGFHAEPYQPELYLVKLEQLEAVLAGGNSWAIVPDETLVPDWAWPHPVGGSDPNCDTNWFSGMAYDWEHELLYVLHEGYGVHVLGLGMR
jgi:hypothetical protein